MKKYFKCRKEELVVIDQVLRDALKKCPCYFGSLDTCHLCQQIQAIVAKTTPAVETYLGRKQST
jgi:hypothetical protein